MAVTVHRQVLEHIKASTVPLCSFGFLIGHKNGNNLWTVVSYTRCVKFDPVKFKSEAENVSILLAGGLLVCGIYIVSENQAPDVQSVTNNVMKYPLDETVEGDAVIVVITKQTDNLEDNIYLQTHNQTLVKATTCITDSDILQDRILVRAKCSFPITLQITEKIDSWRTSLSSQVEDFCDRVKSDYAFYHIKDSNVLIGKNQNIGVPENCTCSILFDFIQSDSDSYIQTKQKKKNTKSGSLHVSLYLQTSGSSNVENSPSYAPVIHYKKENFKSCSLVFPVDVVAIVEPDTSVTKLSEMLSDAICHQLEAMQTCFADHKQKETFFVPVPYHFLLPESQTMLTVVYPNGRTDEQLEGQRREIHKLFGLQEDRPLFRRCNAFMFPEDRANHGYLINPHEGISATKSKVGKFYLVKGMYSYHHYMQDRFDDDKWGCAYRSLQTLISWFRFQGYTEKQIPTHKEIQQALVDVGDKEPKFVGTRKWIGSLEVSYCLDHVIGVTSKIMFVSSGAELGSKGRELAMHFETQGTPIMIGGGVLAHTILGVDFDEVTGNIRFLILDPHYTEAEDLKVILDKGWCGWKSTDFWDKTAYYNLCLPQRPAAI